MLNNKIQRSIESIRKAESVALKYDPADFHAVIDFI